MYCNKILLSDDKYRVGTKMLIEFEFRTWVADAVLFSVKNKTYADGLALEMVNGSVSQVV